MANDLEIAKTAVRRGLLGQEQLDACLAERREQLSQGLLISLQELIVAGGHLDAARWGDLASPEGRQEIAETGGGGVDPPREQAPSQRLPHELLGGYRVVSELGRGAMGVVYEAVQEGLGRRVALKVLPEVSARPGVARERFTREAQATASLKHPGIVPIYAIGEERGIHFFAMELLSGRSLKQLLDAEGPLEPERAARLAQEVAEALEYAHQNGVVHRDVKPDNIIVREDGRAIVTDFGLARRVADHSLTRAGVVVGTPLYMAPEQALGDGQPIDGRADIYGLGITLYELLAGAAPFDKARDTGILLEKVAYEEPPSLAGQAPGLPEALVNIVEVAISKAPEERFQTAGAMAADLGRFLAGDPIHAHPPSRLTRALRRARRSKKQLFALGCALGLLLLAGATLGRLSRSWRADALVLESITLAQAGQLGAARGSLDEALRLQPGLPEALFRQGELDLAEGKGGDVALAKFEATLERDPAHTDALLARGELFRAAGRSAEALADFEAARAAAAEGDPRPALRGGLALAALDRDGDARAWLRDGLEQARATRAGRDALYAEAVCLLGELELRRGRPAAALPELEEAVRLGPTQVRPRILLAQALLESGADQGAVDAAAAALVREPSSLRARALRAEANRRLGNYRDASRDLSESLALPSARLLRGLVRFEALDLGDKARAPLAFNARGSAKDLELAASDLRLSDSRRGLARVALGWLRLCAPRGRKSPALRELDEAVRLVPSSVFARLSRGFLFVRWGRLDEAEAELRVVLDLEGDGYSARVGLAQVAALRGKPAEARRLLDEAIALAPERTTAYGERYRLRRSLGDPAASQDWARGLTRKARTRTGDLRLTLESDPLALAEVASEAGFEEFAEALTQPRQGHLERAGAWLRRARVFDPGNLSAAARSASVIYLLGDPTRAEAAYAEARSVDPSLVEADLMRGVIQRDLTGPTGPAKAEATLRRALQEAPPSRDLQGRLRYELARALERQGKREEALQLLEEALTFTPDRYCVAALRARLIERTGRPGLDAAIDLSARLFREGKRDRIRGTLYAAAGARQSGANDALACQFLTRAIEADHRNAAAWRLRARVQLRGTTGQMAGGLIDSFVAAELDPQYLERFLELETRLARFRPLLQHVKDRVEQLLSVAPELPAATFAKGYLLFQEQDYAAAEHWFNEAFERSRKSSYFALTYRAASKLRQGHVAGAAADLSGAEELFPGGPLTAFWRACVAASQGKDDVAFALLSAQAERGTLFLSQVKDAPELTGLREEPRMVELLQGVANPASDR